MRTPFTIALRGYDLTEVDRLLDESVAALSSADGNRRAAAVDALRSARFRVRLRGYARDEVDQAVDRRIQELERQTRPASDRHHPDAADILGLRQEFDHAELQADRVRLDALLTEDFRSIGERGYVLTKAQWIARHSEFRYRTLDTTETDVRCYAGTAVLRAVQRSTATWRGEALTLAVRLSQVWVQQPDGWKLAALQFSSLPDE